MYSYLRPERDGLPMRLAGPWAADKLAYLRRYIWFLNTTMRGKWQHRNYVDLMAGPGKNEVRGTGEVLLGSPLIALTSEVPFTSYYFGDIKQANIRALRARCEGSSLSQLAAFAVGDCNDLVDAVVAQLKLTQSTAITLAFLDPEGLELHWSTVSKLASIRRMDLIVNYPEGGLNRVMSKVFDRGETSPVDQFFGTPDWRAIYMEYLKNRHYPLHRSLIDLYKARLSTLGYVEVRNSYEPQMRNQLRNAPLYRLLFASKHPLGEKFWAVVTGQDSHGQRRILDA